MRLQREDATTIPDGLASRGPDIFAISQYNKSIGHLKQHTALSTFENLEITLMCCLVFICLETARGNADASRTHIFHGLEIIQKLVSSTFFLYCSIDDKDERIRSLENAACLHGFNPSRLSKTEWRHLLHFFGELELGAALYDDRTVPVISLLVLDLDEWFVEQVPEFRSVDEMTQACLHWYFHVFARLYRTAPYKGNARWWASPKQQRLHERLLLWGRKLSQRIDEFLTGPYAPESEESLEFCSVRIIYHGTLRLLGGEADRPL
jgi:hypothetical protein